MTIFAQRITKNNEFIMNKLNFEVLAKENVFDLINKDWMLITAGDSSNFNTMTASWGGMGWLWNRPVAFLFVRKERFTHQFIEQNSRLTLSFYAEEYRKALQICGSKSGRDTDKVALAGLTPMKLEDGTMTFDEARMTVCCRKLFATDMIEADFADAELYKKFYNSNAGGTDHTLYIVEIESVYTK